MSNHRRFMYTHSVTATVRREWGCQPHLMSREIPQRLNCKPQKINSACTVACVNVPEWHWDNFKQVSSDAKSDGECLHRYLQLFPSHSRVWSWTSCGQLGSFGAKRKLWMKKKHRREIVTFFWALNSFCCCHYLLRVWFKGLFFRGTVDTIS